MDGDSNSTFFHACLVDKRRKHILDMRAVDGVVFYSPEAIHQGAVGYFSGFLQAGLSRDLRGLSYLISPIIFGDENVCTCLTGAKLQAHSIVVL